MPVFELLGGKAREAIDTYGHASGGEISEAIDSAKKYIAQGFRHVRVQVGVPGMAGYGSRGGGKRIDSLHNAPVFEREGAKTRALKLFEAARKELGPDIELLHDAHERYTPSEAVQLCKDLEQYRLFFLEDPLSPEDIMWFPNIRAQTTTPLAMGELFNNPNEWLPLVTGRLIDFIRIHLSQIGGLTPARKVAALCEFFAVRTAWHGPGDVSPVGHAANVHLDLAVPNFGVQESREFTPAERDVFPGCPEIKDGMLTASDKPGLGVDVDEKLAAKFPIKDDPPFDFHWGELRRRDGAVTKP
jgi:mannonate dehydratase